MKNYHHSKKNGYNDYDYEDEDDYRPSKKKESPRRRPVRNWKKAWSDQEFLEDDDYKKR